MKGFKNIGLPVVSINPSESPDFKNPALQTSVTNRQESQNFVSGQQGSMVDWATGKAEFSDLYVTGFVKTVSVGGDIQGAIDILNLHGGGEVRLDAGTHILTNNLTLYSNISLVGAGIDSTVLDFNGGAYQVLIHGDLKTSGGTGVSITEGSTTVTGVGGTTFLTDIEAGDILLVSDTNFGTYAEVATITDDTTIVLKDAWPYPTVTNVNGLFFTAKSNVQIKNLTITNSSKSGSSVTSGILSIYTAVNFQLENVLITKNTASPGVSVSVAFNSELKNIESTYNGNSTVKHGFLITSTRRIIFYNCTAIGNGGDGFAVGTQNFNFEGDALYSCFAEGNTQHGFNLKGTANLLSCQAFGNDGAGFNITGDNNVLTACSATENVLDGIQIGTNGTENVIQNCLLKRNDAFGIDISGSINFISKCMFSSNVSGTIQDAGTRTHYDNQGSGSFTAVNGANNNIDISEDRFVRISGPTGAFSISGIAGGVNGKTVTLYNAVAFDFTITNDATSTAANRILTLTGADVTLTGVSAATLMYNLADARWLLVNTQG